MELIVFPIRQESWGFWCDGTFLHSLKWFLLSNVGWFKGWTKHRRPSCNGNVLIYKCPPSQLIHPSSWCVNVIKVVYSIDKWHHSALKPDLLISCWLSRNSCINWMYNLSSLPFMAEWTKGRRLLRRLVIDSCALGGNLLLVWINHLRSRCRRLWSSPGEIVFTAQL